MDNSITHSQFFDIIVVTDPRFQGGTSTAIAAEVAASVLAGYTVGLVCLEAGNIRQPLPFNPKLSQLIDAGKLTLVWPGSPVQCTLGLLHNPYTAALIPVQPVQIAAKNRLLVVHHPPFDANGMAYYDTAIVDRNAQDILGGPVTWVPVGPNARCGFDDLADAPTLAPYDWPNVIDAAAWRRSAPLTPREKLTIGRHSRPDMRKFPDDRESFVTIYGEDTDVHVDLMGCPAELRDHLSPLLPSWACRPFGALDVADYLDQLDVFVYFHRSDWVEAFGYTVLEAMARGVPCVLDATMAPSFEGACVIAAPEDALSAARSLAKDPEPTRQAAFALIAARHSFEAVAKRLKDLIGPPALKSQPAPAHIPAELAVLFVSTNGIGMGHIARCIAMARRLQAPIRPVMVTMSQGAPVAAEFGYHFEFIPYHTYLGVDQKAWNRSLREEIIALVDAFDARALVFDGNSPFQGLIDALQTRPQVWSVWSRRGMWAKGAGAEFIAREGHFDLVLEPQDLAEDYDEGLTRHSTSRTRKVPPVLMLDGSEHLPRSIARAELGIDAGKVAVLVQLGGGQNFDLRLCRDLVFRHLGQLDEVQIVVVDWKIAPTALDGNMPPNLSRISTFPVARYLKAFDATVSVVGYNSFHETTAAALPAIYIPNENPAQDNQLARAAFAARRGAARLVRHNQPEQLIAALDHVLVAENRAKMSAAAQNLPVENGAIHAANIISQLVQCRRGDG